MSGVWPLPELGLIRLQNVWCGLHFAMQAPLRLYTLFTLPRYFQDRQEGREQVTRTVYISRTFSLLRHFRTISKLMNQYNLTTELGTALGRVIHASGEC